MELDSFESRCQRCGKLLTKPTVRIENKSLSHEDFDRFRNGAVIQYGAETMCRKCKRPRETLVEAKQKTALRRI